MAVKQDASSLKSPQEAVNWLQLVEVVVPALHITLVEQVKVLIIQLAHVQCGNLQVEEGQSFLKDCLPEILTFLIKLLISIRSKVRMR